MTEQHTTLCACGHSQDRHEHDPGDTRCLVVDQRQNLSDVFDDGRETAHGYCGCLQFTPTTAQEQTA